MKGRWVISRGFVLFVAVLALTSCKDDNISPKGLSNVSDSAYVNLWIQDNMEFYYLWNDEIPAKPDTSVAPDKFFESLLSNEDRFSWIQPNFIELLNSLRGVNKEAGYDFKLYRESDDENKVFGQIMYIKKGSLVETQNKDLKRGDIFTHINGQQLTISNYQNLLAQTNEDHTLTYLRLADTGWEEKGTITLNTAEFAENPSFLHKVIDAENNHKIGYYVYNFFAVGPTATSTQYNDEMNEIFAEFKSAGITDLIVDLRYNSGGAEGATIRLASLIGNNISSSDVFTRREYNPGYQAAIVKQLGSSYLLKKFENNANNVGPMLNKSRVYILTSFRTASASELLINGLKPFMDVFLIGDVTVGKNVGSITIYEQNDPRNTWGMQPIVVKSYNSNDESNYSEGFTPNIVNRDNSLDIKAIGDEDETLLSLAIEQITGGNARKHERTLRDEFEVIGASPDFKRGGYNLVIEDEAAKRIINFSSSN